MEQLLADIDAFLAKHDMAEREFGRLALNDHYFVRDIRGDRSPSLKTVDKVRRFMDEYVQQQAAA